MTLTELPALLREEPSLFDVLGRSNAVLSVADPGLSMVIAALVRRSDRHPFLVGVPSTADAERIASDLETLLGSDRVERFPAWETLPFERVSPTVETMGLRLVETMGLRLRTLWRLRGLTEGDPDRVPSVVVAPIRALTQRLAPRAEVHTPLVVHQGGTVVRDDVATWLASAGYRREDQVEHRGEFAVRGSIVDVFPSTADHPVRIDLWDNEVDRLTTFAVGDQRSAEALEHVEIFACRELVATEAVRARAVGLVASEPWGREQWEKLAEGLVFDGMESWLPWLSDDDRVIADFVGERAQVVWCEPKRMRDRAVDMLAEEDDLARTLARTWGAMNGEQDDGEVVFPRLHIPFDRLLGATDLPMLNVVAVPDSPDVARVSTVGWNQAVGDGAGLVRQARQLLADGFTLIAVADTEASQRRVRELLSGHGIDVDVRVGPIDRGVVFTAAKLAVLAEGDLTGRRRSHRPA